MALKDSYQTGEQFGVLPGFFDLSYRILHKLLDFQLLDGITLSAGDISLKFITLPSGFTISFMDQNTLKAFSIIEPVELSSAFLKAALQRGDRCVGVMANGSLVSFGWYSTTSTSVTTGLALRFDPGYVYMYKGYTVPEYRGKQLHAYGMAYAVNYFSAQGYKGLISYVEANNFRSIQSCKRLGYKRFGRLLAFRVLGQQFSFSSKGCKQHGFRLEHQRVNIREETALPQTVK